MSQDKGESLGDIAARLSLNDGPVPRGPQAGMLSRLAPELVEMIADSLDGRDNSALRQTCRYMYHCTFQHFAKTYIGSIQPDFSADSFSRLQRLADDEQIAPCVTKMVVKMRRDDSPGLGYEWQREYHKGPLVMTQETVQQWKDLIQRFVNCSSFWVDIYENNIRGHSHLAPRDTLALVLNIISKISKSHRQVVEFGGTIFWGDRKARIWPEQRLSGADFAAIWSKVEVLDLEDVIVSPSDTTYLLGILTASTRLRRLRITRCPDAILAVLDMIRLLGERSSSALHLEDLYIEHAAFPNDESIQNLVTILRYQGKSLRNLYIGQSNIHRSNIHNGWWMPVLVALRDHCSGLEKITLSLLGLGTHRTHPDTLHFSTLKRNPIVVESGGERSSFDFGPQSCHVSYSGRKMDLALQKLVDAAEVHLSYY